MEQNWNGTKLKLDKIEKLKYWTKVEMMDKIDSYLSCSLRQTASTWLIWGHDSDQSAANYSVDMVNTFLGNTGDVVAKEHGRATKCPGFSS